ncbi:MAG: hypothetical protein ACE5G2_02805 [Candidatus Krumholzibacteriia bacterium]
MGSCGAARAETEAAGDSVRHGALLDKLQAEDRAYFGEDLLRIDTSFRDTVLAEYDSLGLDTYRELHTERARRLALSFDLAERLWAYNRVEGLVAGARVALHPVRQPGPRFEIQGAYATGSEKFRHHEALHVPLGPKAWRARLRVHYADRVVPYGSNRPAVNSLRALVGAEDAQDYLRREGGGVGLTWSPAPRVGLEVAYEAAEESSVSGSSDFSVFGDLVRFNAPVDVGIDRAVVGSLRLGSLERELWQIDLAHRVAGGGLGGDFAYNRSDLAFSARRYLGRQEFTLDLGWVRTGGDAPVQRLADFGGLSTVRGFERRTRVGEASFTARLEYLVPYDLLRAADVPVLRHAGLQLVPWLDAGRTWDSGSDAWIHSTGLGLQRFLGPFGQASYLRLDLAFPLGPDRPEAVRFDLRFARGFF